jgi:KDO2-lipid IV(A) lauroyltransferase
MFYIFYLLVWLPSLLPLKVLYILADCIYPVVYHAVKYRRKVVRHNLTAAFPQKSDAEIIAIEKDFYHYFCDMMVEMLHFEHISSREFRRRFDVSEIETLEKLVEQYGSVMVITAHYGNWEWGAALHLFMPDVTFCNIYKRLKNRKFDNFMQKVRGRFGGVNVEMKTLLRKIHEQNDKKSSTVYIMIADQRPARSSIRHRTTFLNQDTAVVTGPEKLAKRFGFPMIYIHIERRARGYYKLKYFPLTGQPSQQPDFSITDRYLQILENEICQKPAYWLWTHNRWKY